MEGAYYDTAQVCLNGHAITGSVKRSPERMQKHCDDCSAETITQCPSCKTEIRGDYHIPKVLGFGFPYMPPSYCHECGNPYPWTQQHLQAMQELVELAAISAEEKASIKDDLPNLLTDTPRTNVAAAKMGQFLKKAGDVVGPAMREIIAKVASEAVKNIMFPPHP